MIFNYILSFFSCDSSVWHTSMHNFEEGIGLVSLQPDRLAL